MTIPETGYDAENIIADVNKSLVEKAVGDIHRAVGRKFPNLRVSLRTNLKAGDASLVGAFLLSCCAIEAAGHFYCGSSRSRQSFELFSRRYLGIQYESTVLYKALRCGLAHSYSLASDNQNLRERYDLTHNNSLAHLQPDRGDPFIRYINLQNFIVDVTNAVETFMDDVTANENHERFWFLHYAESAGWLNEFMVPTAQTGTSAPAPMAPPIPQPAWTFPALPFPNLWNGITPPGIPTGKPADSEYEIFQVPADGVVPPAGLSTLRIAGSGHSTPSDLGVAGTMFVPTTATRDVTLAPNFYAVLPSRNQRRTERKKRRKRKLR